MSKLGSDHLHVYRRIKGSKTMYVCDHPDCTHRMTREYLVGKRALCPKCNQAYEIKRSSLTLARPHCENCTREKK